MKRPACSVVTAFVPAMCLLGFAVPSLCAADKDAAATKRRIDALVLQLGDAAYTQREQASKELVKLGIAAEPALTAALKDPDAEVRFRAADVLAIVREADFRARLEAFAAEFKSTSKFESE